MEKTSIERAFEILDLLDERCPTVSPEQVAEVLGLTRSTTYRYLKILCGAGLLMQLSRGRYSLGPRIVELERKIEVSDPMLAVGRHVMPAQADRIPNSVLILCGLWGDRVLCLRQENASQTEASEFRLSRARGLPFSLFKGAASLSILANLAPARIKSIYLRFGQDIAAAGLGESWAEFRSRLQSIRKAGYCITTGTFDSGMTAVSAPILNSDGEVLGSLTRILKRSHAANDGMLIAGVREAAAEFAAHLGADAGKAQTDAGVLPEGYQEDAVFLESLVEHVKTT